MTGDLRFAMRAFRRAPGFTAIAVATLALGIGANTAIFSLFYSLVLKPPPFREPGRLIVAWDTYQPQFSKLGVSPAELKMWSAQTDLLEATAWYRYVSNDLALTAAGMEPMEAHATFISPNLLSMLGISPAIGRAPQAPDEAVISDSLWRERFASSAEAVGRSVRLNGATFTITGVMPASFKLPDWADVWLAPGPMLGDVTTNPVRHALAFVARLRAGVTEAQAAGRLESLSKRLAAENPKTSTGWGMRVSGLQDDLTVAVRPALRLLIAAVALVLLIACANVANLLLARAAGREREMATRVALGASAWQVARQMLVESASLAAMGGAVGIALAAYGVREFAPPGATMDARVLLFALGVTAAAGIVFGLAPALHALRHGAGAGMKSSGVVAGSLVAGEFALALILVSSAGVLLESLATLMHVDPGFDPHGVLTMRLDAPPSHDASVLFRRIAAGVRELPGVDGVACANELPLVATRANTSRFNVPGNASINPNALPAAQIRAVSPEYFRAMGIAIRSGRGFTEADLNRQVAIINETMARRFWPGRDPVGEKYVSGVWGPSPTYSTIIGVARDVKQFGLDSEPSFDEYFPSEGAQYLIVHARGDAERLSSAAVRVAHSADPEVAVADVRTMQQIAAESAHTRTLTLNLLGAFAVLALALALAGTYGVMARSVERRTREIGIRVALGASPGAVAWLILARAAKLSLIGSGAGIVGSIAARRLLSAFIYGAAAADAWIYVAAAGAMAAAALAACVAPALRASRADAAAALRSV